MPEFANPFSGLDCHRRLSHRELVRAVRFMIGAEYEAVQRCMQLAGSRDHELAAGLLPDIVDEERVHAGAFMHLLKILAPGEEGFYREGAGGSRRSWKEQDPGELGKEPGELSSR